MTGAFWGLLAAFLALLLVLAWPLGRYMARLLEAEPARGRVARGFYRLCGVDPAQQMGWLHYTLALVLFNAIGALAVYAIQRTQAWLPLNPQHLANVSPDSAFDTALSFVTNTDWQGYSGESTMSHLTQMLALAVQNFFSAATDIAVAIALIRGFARHGAKAIGNAWVDLTRSRRSAALCRWCVAAAKYQVARVARATGLSVDRVQALVDRRSEEPLGGWLGEARVNVLQLNLDLDEALAH